MAVRTVFDSASVSVFDYRCEARPGDAPFVEWHDAFSVSYVRHGSFGYRFRGSSYKLVAGSFLVGHPGDEYMCTHDHVGGDECLSFYFDPSARRHDRRSHRGVAGGVPATARRYDGAWRARAGGRHRPERDRRRRGRTAARRPPRRLRNPGARAGRRTRRHAIAAVRSKPRSGSTPIRTSPSSSTMPPRKRASVLSISCACSRTCSASPRISTSCVRACVTPRACSPTTAEL